MFTARKETNTIYLRHKYRLEKGKNRATLTSFHVFRALYCGSSFMWAMHPNYFQVGIMNV